MRLTGQSYKKINGSVSKLKVCIKHGTPTWHHLLFKPTRILTEPESLDVGFVSWKEKGERPECYIPIGPCLVISSPQSSCKDHHPFQRPYGYSSMSNLSLIYSFIHSFNKQSFRVRLEATYSFWSGSFLHLQSQQAEQHLKLSLPVTCDSVVICLLLSHHFLWLGPSSLPLLRPLVLCTQVPRIISSSWGP